jgi:hypothetical protein
VKGCPLASPGWSATRACADTSCFASPAPSFILVRLAPSHRLDRKGLKTGFSTFLQTLPPPMPFAHSSLHHKLVQNSINHRNILDSTRPNLRLSSTLINLPHIHRPSSPSNRPLQITSFLVTQSPFRHQIHTIGKSLCHSEHMKSAASLTRKTQ